jgi:hypothetical protein
VVLAGDTVVHASQVLLKLALKEPRRPGFSDSDAMPAVAAEV